MSILGKQLAVMGLLVDNRYKNAPQLQEILTEHGAIIRCRTGVSEENGRNGLITLLLIDAAKREEFGWQNQKDTANGKKLYPICSVNHNRRD